MIYFFNHALNLRRVFHFHRIVHFTKTQRLNRSQLRFRPFDYAPGLCDLNFCHDAYPLKTFDNETPRLRAIVCGSRIVVNALKVAFTTLCGFEDPFDLANTL